MGKDQDSPIRKKHGRIYIAGVIVFFALLLTSSVQAKILDTLIFRGLSYNRPEIVKNNIELIQGEEFYPQDIRDQIRELYNLELFSDIQCYTENETDSSVSLIFEFKENPVCEKIEYKGFDEVEPDDFEDSLKITQGMPFDDALIFKTKKMIEDRYSEKGYLLAEVTHELVPADVPGNFVIKFKVDEGKKVRIEEITISGNSEFSDKKLKRKLKTKENRLFTKGEYDRKLFPKHLDSLMMYYHSKGYLDAHVKNDSMWYSDDKEDIFINIEVEEGQQYYTGDFYFSGNEIIESEKLSKRVTMKRGKPFDKGKFSEAQMVISNAYREEGYLWVQLKEDYRYRNDTIDVIFEIEEGRPAVVDMISIRGNTKTFDKVVRRELRLFPGEKYRQSMMERSIREAMALNYFENVVPDMQQKGEGVIDLLFNVKEKENIGQFSAGAVFSQVEGLGGNFSVSIPNFRGRGQEVSAQLDYLQNRQSFSMSFKDPWFLDRPLLVSASAFYSRYTYVYGERDTIQSYGIRLGVGKDLKWPDDYFSVFFSYQLSREEESRTSRDVRKFDVLDQGYLSKIGITLRRDDTDMPKFPNRGSDFSLELKVAGLGGAYMPSALKEYDLYNYFKSKISYDVYLPLLWKFVMGFKSEFGVIGGFNPNPTISRYDLFSAGGVYYGSQLRGYPEESFGGRFHMNRGTTMLVFSSELRVPILPQQLYVGLFCDMGNTWNDVGDINLSDMYVGVGFGIRLMFPMLGLLGFDFGWPLDDPDNIHFDEKTKSKPEFHFLMNRGF